MLGAAAAMAVGTVLCRYATRRSDPVAVTGWHLLFGGLPLLPPVLLDPASGPHWTLLEWGLMAYASLLGSALAYGLFFWFASSGDLTGFTSLTFLTPVFALLCGVLFLQEGLQPLQWFGAALALVSVVLIHRRQRLWRALRWPGRPCDGDPVVSTPVGCLGSGQGGGVELTAASLVAGLQERGHRLTVLAGEGSRLPEGCGAAELWCEAGAGQPSWQHRSRQDPVEIPADALLPRLWRRALAEQHRFDVLVNLAYDWLPLWLTPPHHHAPAAPGEHGLRGRGHGWRDRRDRPQPSRSPCLPHRRPGR